MASWANLPDPGSPKCADAVERLFKKYPELLGGLAKNLSKEDQLRFALGIREHLRQVWDSPDLRHREWYLYRLRDLYDRHSRYLEGRELAASLLRVSGALDNESHTTMAQASKDVVERGRFWGLLVEGPPDLTLFERSMFRFHRVITRARHCGNPECPAPYFFATKKRQKFCSPVCGAPSQRESKMRWWRANRAKSQSNKKRSRTSRRAQ